MLVKMCVVFCVAVDCLSTFSSKIRPWLLSTIALDYVSVHRVYPPCCHFTISEDRPLHHCNVPSYDGYGLWFHMVLRLIEGNQGF